MYIVDEVTMNMAEYGSWRSQQSANVNFDPIIWGLKRDIFVWDQVYNPFHICKIQLQKKKKWGKKCLEICAIKGGSGGTKEQKSDYEQFAI